MYKNGAFFNNILFEQKDQSIDKTIAKINC